MKAFWFVFGNLWKMYVGLVFGLTAILLYPIFLLVLTRPNGKEASFRWFVFWSKLFCILCFYRVKSKGNKLKDEPFILVANHTSYLDIFLMFSHFPERPFLFMGKSEILSYPILNTYFKKLNIPVNRSSRSASAKSFLQARKALQEGFSLIIFPEGGIPNLPPPQMSRFKDGAFRLALLMKAPILPVAFLNNYRLMSDPSMVFGPASPGVSKAIIFEPLRIESDELLNEQKLECRKKIENALKEKS
jgi:1-acyl-sn-glycerol-3-phosphate acyltransferase